MRLKVVEIRDGNPVLCPDCWERFDGDFHAWLLQCVPDHTGALS